MNNKYFSELYTIDYNISKIFPMKQLWENNSKFTMEHPRPTNALLLFTGCNGHFVSPTKEITVPEGSLFFIPANSVYSWTFSGTRHNEVPTMLFEFLLTDSNGDIINIQDDATIIDISDLKLYKNLFERIIYEFSKPRFSVSKLKSVAYSLIGTVSEEGQKNQILSDRLSCIYEGIKYLENDILQEKTIEEVAQMCCVSINYFERLFKEYAGTTPSKYRQQRKLYRACQLLESGIFNVKQVAYETGFTDYPYFCRVFKKMYGCTPSDYKKTHKFIDMV